MFCPKCGMQNPDTGKFCRSCGTDLGNVSAALTGNLPARRATGKARRADRMESEDRRRQDPNEVYGDAVKQILTGVGFLIVAIVLFTTGVAGGRAWWWAMLFPAFGCLGKGAADYLKSKRMINSAAGISAASQSPQNIPNRPEPNAVLPPPPPQTDYVRPPQKSVYDTGEFVAPPAPSVTEGTTRHLEINSEGETMTLPKK